MSSPSGNPILEILIHGGDLRNAQKYARPGHSGPSLCEYLAHLIPRRRTSDRKYAINSPLHHDVESNCCHLSATVNAVSTIWPLFLRVNPVWDRATGLHSDVKDVACPLHLVLGSDVYYEMVGRINFCPNPMGTGHFQTVLRIGWSAYRYDDLVQNGTLVAIGGLDILEEFNMNTACVLYIRVSATAVRCTLSSAPCTSKLIIIIDTFDQDNEQSCG